jgi:DNA polymerase V
MIQLDVYGQTGLYVTIGIGDNPLLAKLAMDNEAKKNENMRAEWTYQDIQKKVWKIQSMTEFWSINSRTAKRLEKIGVRGIEELANIFPSRLKKEFGKVRGLELFHHANGVDRTRISESYLTKSPAFSNSQVLPYDYIDIHEIELVIKEMGDQIATRIRRRNQQAEKISLYIGYSMSEEERGFSKQMKIPATNQTIKISNYLLQIFHEYYTDKKVRHIGVSAGHLIYSEGAQLDLFSNPYREEQLEKMDRITDLIRQKYGFTSLVHASSLLSGGRAIYRSNLVGGHAGGADGLE